LRQFPVSDKEKEGREKKKQREEKNGGRERKVEQERVKQIDSWKREIDNEFFKINLKNQYKNTK
jgi:hypothetical protein